MTTRRRIVTATATGGAAVALLLALLVDDRVTPAVPLERVDRPHGVRVGCDRQSGAGFPGAYANPRNLVVGPLALIGGSTFTDVPTALEYRGNKLPLLVRAGHTVTVSVPESHRAIAGLNHGSQPLRRHTITFTACPARLSSSRADGPVTFWSGFVLTTVPSCVPLDVWVDRRPRRRVGVALGRRCTAGSARARAPQPPLRGCAMRVEAGRRDDDRPRPGEVAIGPLRFTGLAGLASGRRLGFDRVAGVHRVKVGVGVPAGVGATLSIGASARGRAALTYAPVPPGVKAHHPAGQPAVRFQACPADQPAFSHDGPVGPVTGFSGGFILIRPGCVPLEIAVPGRPLVRARVPFGVGRC